VTLAATGLLLAAALPQYLIAAVAVSIREDFPFSNGELGAAVAISFGIAALVTPFSGRLIRGIGILMALYISVVLLVASTLAIAILADSAAALILFGAVAGLSAGFGSPAYSGLLAAGVRPERHGTAFGLLSSAPQASAFIAGLGVPAIADPFGWRVAFLLPAAISLISLLGLRGTRQLASRARVAAPRIGRARRLRAIHVIALSALLASSSGIGMRAFLVVFAVGVGFSSGDAGLLLAVSGLVALGSRLGAGVLGDRRPGDGLKRAALLMVLSALGFALMALSVPVAVVVGALVAGGLGWGWMAPLNLAVIQRHPEAPAAAIGTQLSGFFAGAVIGPLLVAALVGAAGFAEAWIVCGLLVLGAAGAAYAARLMPSA
jgi:MFS family permease